MNVKEQALLLYVSISAVALLIGGINGIAYPKQECEWDRPVKALLPAYNLGCYLVQPVDKITLD